MKHYLKYGWLCSLLPLLFSCAEEESAEVNREAKVFVSVAPMELKGELEGVQTRAFFPLRSEKENLVKTLSLVAFDEEGLHYIENENYYEFLQFFDADNPDGKQTLLIPAYTDKLQNEGTLCAIANMSRYDLIKALRDKATEAGGKDVITLNQFKDIKVALPYIEKRDSVGLVRDIYMFGDYKGILNPYPGKEHYMKILLGRIISRLSLSLSVDPEVEAAGLKYFINLKKTSREAYIFPGDHSPDIQHDDPHFFPVSLSQEPLPFFYYLGPHSANNESEATTLEIAYGKDVYIDSDGNISKNAKIASVALCNDPPGTENRHYWLNRNSAYYISIRLVKKNASAAEDVSTYGTAPLEAYQVEIDMD